MPEHCWSGLACLQGWQSQSSTSGLQLRTKLGLFPAPHNLQSVTVVSPESLSALSLLVSAPFALVGTGILSIQSIPYSLLQTQH